MSALYHKSLLRGDFRGHSARFALEQRLTVEPFTSTPQDERLGGAADTPFRPPLTVNTSPVTQEAAGLQR